MCNYSVLGLKKGATIIEIKKRYRVLSLELHPDVNGGDENKTKKFLLVKTAYEALLVGDKGVKQPPKPKYEPEPKKQGSYRFVGVKKRGDDYLLEVEIENVSEIHLRGVKNSFLVGSYSVENVEGKATLRVSSEDMKTMNYYVKIRFYDFYGNHGETKFKVKKPTLWQKIKKIFA